MRYGTRTGMATLLVAAMLVVPCVAWYLVGSRATAREAARIERDAVSDLRQAAQEQAVTLAVRLEGLREVEASRPFFHYEHRYHDPADGCACAAFKLSPLAEGGPDPLVEAYFQVDGGGDLTLPTLDGDANIIAEGEWSRRQLGILRRLAPARLDLEAAIDQAPERSEAPHFRQVHQVSGDPGTAVSLPEEEHEEHLILSEPFRWRTVDIGGTPELLALRHVVTSHQVLLQGFIVRRLRLDAILHEMAAGSRLLPGRGEGGAQAELPIPGAVWRVQVEEGDALVVARQAAANLASRFRMTFVLGAAAAGVAGLLVILLIAQSERLARQRAQFAAAAAHELRTPLAGIRLHGEMLAGGLGDRDSARGYAARMAEDAERLGRVVTNVLGFTRLEQSGVQVRAELGDLGTTVRRAAEQIRPAVEAAGGTLDVRIPAGLPAVRFDADAVQHIVHNLVDNAEKYSRESEDRTIEVSLEPRAAGVELSVRDHGPGIAGPVQRRLFRPFVRGHGGQAPAGLGLGLTLVRALATAQGGEVRWTRADGRGTVFTVSFAS